jgi:hypothetical protein
MMKYVGIILLTAGFLAGALVSVIDEQTVRWPLFALATAVGAAGVILMRIGHRRTTSSQTVLTENIQTIETALERIVENITGLNRQKQTINTYDVRGKIDRIFAADLLDFINARASITHIYGLKAYAEVMSSFAAGERYLNRVWSASADGYIDEVYTYLDKAQEQFCESWNKLKGLKKQDIGDRESKK